MSTATAKTSSRKPRALHGVWISGRTFVLAAVGGAMWLNNLYQLPYLASNYGGSAFLIVYLIGIALIGLPLVLAELVIGQHGRMSPPASIAALAQQARISPRWAWLGYGSVVAAFLVFSFYSVIGGWTLAHTARATFGAFSGLTVDGLGTLFSAFLSDPEKQLFWHVGFLAMALSVSARSLHGGIEFLSKFAVPVICAMLAIFALYAMSLGSLSEAASRYLEIDFTRLSGEGVLLALAHAFFGLALGLGIFLSYGARLGADAPPPLKLALYVVGLDFAAAILAGFVILPLLYAGGFNAQAGLAVIFQTLPIAFDQFVLGGLMRVMFFLTVVLVMWVSATAILEPVMMWLVERFALSRRRAALYAGLAAWLVGIALILSFSFWRFEFSLFGATKRFGFFDVVLIFTNLLLPLLSIGLALLVGWRLHRVYTPMALRIGSLCVHDVWIWSLRIVAPVLLLIVLYNLPKLFL